MDVFDKLIPVHECIRLHAFGAAAAVGGFRTAVQLSAETAESLSC